MRGSESDSQSIARANELYWGSELSVNQIAEDLDLSKGMLYGMIEPLATKLSCPDCGGGAVYLNRTAEQRGNLACPECAWEGSEDEAEILGGDAAVTLPAALEDEEALPPPAAATDPGRSRVLLGGALVGAAAGLALVLWAKRR
jgi:predicted RNA-binding Zn-ribbon protein involved in translation (DUF1610 family)